MTVIHTFKRSELRQVAPGHYLVISHNNIALFESANIAKAYEYAEWHDTRKAV
jgi:hypothetical protein